MQSEAGEKSVRFQEAENVLDKEDEVEEDLNRQFNKFQFLDAIDSDEIDHEGDEDDEENPDAKDSDDENRQMEAEKSAPSQNLGSSSTSRSSDKKKSKKRRRKNNSSKKEDLDDVLELYQSNEGTSQEISKSNGSDPKLKFLKLDMRNLIPESEIKRMFGKSVLREDKSSKDQKPKFIVPGQFRSRFVSDSQDARIISALNLSGPKMELDEIFNQQGHRLGDASTADQQVKDETQSDKKSTSKRGNKHNKKNNDLAINEKPTYFKFVHDKDYQAAQSLFLEAAQQGNSDAIIHNLNTFPVHAESLVQLSDMIRITEDFKTAAEFIERALLTFEKGFHPRFNMAAANCRLSYKRPENRTFFITIFKHITYCNRRGLRRTPLEYTKLLLGLDPTGDPLYATLMLDFYAIRSEEYDYLIEFAEKWENMSALPNINFSVPLAHFLKSKNLKFGKTVCERNAKLADELLQRALLRYPNFVIALLEACSAEPDSELKKCDYFDYSVYGFRYKTVPQAVELLVSLYVERTSMLWKQKHVLSWLESNVATLVNKFATKELVDEHINVRYWSVFLGPSPRNLLRHITLSELKLKLPPIASQASFLDIDPFPPESIVSYSSRIRIDEANPHPLPGFPGLFLRSILPSFSLTNNEQTTNRPPNQ